jgi:hypothetical protein
LKTTIKERETKTGIAAAAELNSDISVLILIKAAPASNMKKAYMRSV